MDISSNRAILESGFEFTSGTSIISGLEALSAFSDLASAFEQCQSDGIHRRRSYDRCLILPTAPGEFSELQYLSSDFYQSKELNPDDGDKLRSFGALPSEVRENEILLKLIKFDFGRIPLDILWKNFGKNPISVGIHFIRMPATVGCPGVPTPNGPHRDGDFFTFVHLVKRQGVIGGESMLFSSIKSGEELVRGPLLRTLTMENPLDTLAVWDLKVFHDVTPVVVAPDFSLGVRDVILVDFSPMEEVKLDSRGIPSIECRNFQINAA